MLMWAMWKARNTLVWERIQSSVEEVIRTSKFSLDQWLDHIYIYITYICVCIYVFNFQLKTAARPLLSQRGLLSTKARGVTLAAKPGLASTSPRLYTIPLQLFLSF